MLEEKLDAAIIAANTAPRLIHVKRRPLEPHIFCICMDLYPLDYQILLARVIRERLAMLLARGAVEDAARLQDALARLYRSDFGECIACGSVIPYLHITSDPAARHCPGCETH